MEDFSGKVALVTGAAMGIGRATAEAFARAGASVVVSDIDETAGRAVVDGLEAEGFSALFVRCDVADEAQVEALVDKTVEAFGRLDAAFNNAGIQTAATDMADVPGSDYDRVLGVNLRGVWNCVKHELRQMREQGEGAIVNNSSIGGLIGNPGRATYHAAKHGVLGLTKSVALEYAARGIRVNAVCPGTIETPMLHSLAEQEGAPLESFIEGQPIGRAGRPEEIASAVLWLCGPGASLVIGHGLPVDGGYTAQ